MTVAPSPEKLTRREREIMNAIFASGNRATAEEIRTRLLVPPTGSAVRTMLTRLEAKGYLRHHEEGGRYVYSATISHAAAKRSALRHYLRTFFGGSPEQMMTSLLRQESWTEQELDAVSAEIERVRKQKRRP